MAAAARSAFTFKPHVPDSLLAIGETIGTCPAYMALVIADVSTELTIPTKPKSASEPSTYFLSGSAISVPDVLPDIDIAFTH